MFWRIEKIRRKWHFGKSCDLQYPKSVLLHFLCLREFQNLRKWNVLKNFGYQNMMPHIWRSCKYQVWTIRFCIVFPSDPISLIILSFFRPVEFSRIVSLLEQCLHNPLSRQNSCEKCLHSWHVKNGSGKSPWHVTQIWHSICWVAWLNNFQLRHLLIPHILSQWQH